MKTKFLPVLFVICFIFPGTTSYGQCATGHGVTIIRDTWGIPHIFSADECALFFGAGYAAAEDRLLQMTLARYSVQGRLSEFFGQKFITHDKRMRTLGLYKYAERSVVTLPDTVRMWLEAYADGVNAYKRDNPSHLAEVFTAIRTVPDDWTAADCIATFLRIAEYFDRGWTNEVNALRKFEAMLGPMSREEAIAELEARNLQVDNAAAVVSRAEYDRYQSEFDRLSANLPPVGGEDRTSTDPSFLKTGEDEPWTPPKMSHDWVVSGSKSSTGYPILESDPQISVESPPTWYEFHLHGGRFNVRGISMPGNPGMLIGFSEDCSWGLTALGSNNADLFEEELRPGTRNEYKWKGNWETMTEHDELIKVKNRDDVILKVQETRHGPVVNEFCNGVQQNEIFALHWLVLQQPPSSLTGLLKMMAADNWPEFVDGIRDYRSPGTHLIYADRHNNIAYYTMARVPLRVHDAHIPYQGWTGEEEWLGVVPFDEMPRMLNPVAGFISTANNLPIGNWYPYDIGGGIGHNARSWRLVELMTETDVFSPEDFFTVHQDAVSPIDRDFAYFALMAVEEEKPRDPDVVAAAALLKDWDFRQVTSNDIYRMTSIIGTVIKRSLRNTPLENRYLGSDAGLVQLFIDLEAYEDSTGLLDPDPDIRAWLIDQLGELYRTSGIASGGRPIVVTQDMPFQDNLENLGSVFTQYDRVSSSLEAGVVATIWSQRGNSYSQIVNMAEVDSSWSMIPPGNSEVPTSGHFDDQVDMWVKGEMHPAPLSLIAVESHKESERTLQYGSVGIEPTLPQANSLAINAVYPNPFSDATLLRITLAEASDVRMQVRDILGRTVDSRIISSTQAATGYISWQPTDALLEGMYFLTLSTERASTTVRIVFQK
jgi:penicillin G amidase